MASIAMMLGGALANALAFTGSSYLFSQLKSSGVEEERRRHDAAIEQLQAAQAAWAQKRTERLSFLQEQLHRESHAVQTFKDVDEAMQEYALYNPAAASKLTPLEPEPQLSDFYDPSEDQKDREIVFIIITLGVAGLVGYYIEKRIDS